MLQVARLAPRLLSEGSDLVRDFVKNQINGDGGFKDRAGRSDLYYTVFGLQCLAALQVDLVAEKHRPYLESFGSGEGLDFVHLCALARCWALVGDWPEPVARGLIKRIEAFRKNDDGFNGDPDETTGNTYGCFLALGAYQDLVVQPPEPDGLVKCCQTLAARSGGYANASGLPVGNIPATAAAEGVLRHLGNSAPASTADWMLEQCYGGGGFFAIPGAPMPDLLSTATALHALSGLGKSLDGIRESCLDFVDSLWVNRGAFFGNWSDEDLDCEYTFYGLLALGHLSV